MNKIFEFEKIKDLKCGANPHQTASLYKTSESIDYEILLGNDLSYSNILNATSALELISEFFDVAAVAVVKNNQPVSVALGNTLVSAYQKALDSDPVCQFNSTIVFTREVEIELANLISKINFDLIIAPSFSKEALDELSKNKNLKVMKINTQLNQIPAYTSEEIALTPFGAVIQEKDKKDLDVQTFKVLTKKKPAQTELEDMIFAFKVAKHVKSAGVVIAKDLRTLAIVGAEASRIDALEIAYSKVCDSAKDSVVAMDGAITTANNIQVLAQNRSCGIIQPGGTIKDEKLAQYADKMDISMVVTGIRHLKY